MTGVGIPPREGLRVPAAPRPAERPAVVAEVTLADLTRAVMRRRLMVAALALAGGAIMASVALLRARTYTAHASFTPQGSGARSQLSGLAAQFGLSMLAGESGPSPAFYADLARSRAVLRSVADSPYVAGGAGGRRVLLPDVYKVKDGAPALRREQTVDRLVRDIKVDVGRETGMVKLAVRAANPDLAQQLARRTLSVVNDFNMRARRDKAAMEREFTEARLAEFRAELRAAESRVQAFQRQNREFRNSPDLTAEYERLTRDVSMQREVYSSVAQAYAQARIDAARTTPLLTVVEPPERPARPDPRGTVLFTVLGLVAGGALGAALAISRALRADA
jgi:polysaccharide biosynthesis transport protein